MEIGYHSGRPRRTFPRGTRRLLHRFRQRLRALWTQALHEHATPRELASSVAAGVFVGCTPLVGFHLGIAVVVATLLRLNRVWTIVGSRVSFFLTLPWIVLAEIEVAHRLRTGAWAKLAPREALEHRAEYLAEWCFGSIPVGLALGALLGLVAYAVARGRVVTPPTPSPAPPPSSESPP